MITDIFITLAFAGFIIAISYFSYYIGSKEGYYEGYTDGRFDRKIDNNS